MTSAAFTPRERRLVESLRTPRQVQRWLENLRYNHEESGPTLRTLRGVLRARAAHCLEAALSAATILEHHGHPPLLLDLRSQDRLDHVVLLMRHRGLYGAVARSRDPGLHGRKTVFASLEDLVRSYVLPFIDATGRIVGYSTYDLREARRCDWRLSHRNVWRIERILQDNRGRRLATPDAEYERWHARYLAFRTRYPERKPVYYPGRDAWL